MRRRCFVKSDYDAHMTPITTRTVLLLLAACGGETVHSGGQSGQNDQGDEHCEPALTPIEADDRRLGFSADEVLTLLQDHRPVEVRWDQLTPGDASADLALTIAAAGAPAYAEPGGATESCVESAPWLRVPVEMTLTLAGGEVVAAGTTVLDVGALELARVHLTPGWDLPAELAGVYGTQLGAAYAEAVDTYPADTASLDGVWVVVSRTWDAPVLDIAFRFTAPEVDGSVAAWRGTWVVP